MFVLPPSHHHLVSLHAAGVGNDGVWLVFNTTSYGSGGQGAGGGGEVGVVYQVVFIRLPPRCTRWGAGGRERGRGEDVPVGLYPFAPTSWSICVSPHRCTSAHHKLHMYTT